MQGSRATVVGASCLCCRLSPLPAQLHSPMRHISCCAVIDAELGCTHHFCCALTVAARQLHMLQHLLLSGMQGRLWLQTHNLKWNTKCAQPTACNWAYGSLSATQQNRAVLRLVWWLEAAFEVHVASSPTKFLSCSEQQSQTNAPAW